MSAVSGQTLPAPGTVTMFTTTWCGYCRRLKVQMEREGIGFTEVDIEHQPESAHFVAALPRSRVTRIRCSRVGSGGPWSNARPAATAATTRA